MCVPTLRGIPSWYGVLRHWVLVGTPPQQQ